MIAKKNKRTDLIYNICLLLKTNKQFLTSILKNPLYYPIQFVILIVEGINPTIIALLPKLFVDSIVQGNGIYISLLYIVALAVYNIINSFIQTLFSNYKQIVFERARSESKIKALKKCRHLLHSYFDEASNRDVMHRALAYSERGGEQFIESIWSLLTNIVSIVTIIVVFDAIKIWMIVWLFAINIFRLIVNRKTEKIRYDFSMEKTVYDRKKGYYAGVVSGHPTLEDLNVNQGFEKKTGDYINTVEETISLTNGHNKKMFRWLSVINCVSSIQTIVIYGYVGIGMARGEFTLGDYTAVLLTVSRIDLIINKMIDFPRRIFPQALEADNYIKFADTTEVEKSSNIQICSIHTIEFKEVFFKYPGAEEYILENISFKMSSTKKYAIVGVNGAGKSTLIKLIMKFYLPTKGHIYINGIDINDISRDSLWASVGYVPQNINLYSTTIYDNVDLSNKSDLDSVKTVIKFVGLDKKIKMEDYNKSVSRMFDNNGLEFSIGERQKFSIARALIKNPSMFVFDEPTSSLDAESEFEILEALWEISMDRLTIMISHRLSCAKKADEIIFLNNRQISYIGNHNDLFNTCEEYHQMYQKQASPYINS